MEQIRTVIMGNKKRVRRCCKGLGMMTLSSDIWRVQVQRDVPGLVTFIIVTMPFHNTQYTMGYKLSFLS